MNSSPHSTDVPTLNEALGILQDQLNEFKETIDHIEKSKEAARKSAEAAGQIGEVTANLVEPIDSLIKQLDDVDFHSRLDKLDATVSALHTGFQSIQGRLDGVERNLKDDLRNGLDSIKNQLSSGVMTVSNDLESAEKNLKDNINKIQVQITSVDEKVNEKGDSLEELVTRYASTQMKSIKYHQWLHFGTIIGIVSLIALFLNR